MKTKTVALIMVVGAQFGWSFSDLRASTHQEQIPYIIFQDEPAAHALYDKMIETMCNADTLSYESDYRWGATRQCKYRAWMKKPNYFRVEAMIPATMVANSKSAEGKIGGVLVGDGEYLWLYWPNGRPIYTAIGTEAGITYAYTFKKSYLNTYLRELLPVGRRYSIGHKTRRFGCMGMPIINPGIFLGYADADPFHDRVDGVRGMGTEKIADQECDLIEVSILKGQRTRYLWLSKRDCLPRKLKEVIRLADSNLITDEVWSKVTINAEMPTEKFAWKPPVGWTERAMSDPAERLLKPGQEAPDFDLLSAGGTKIKLSDYRGKVIWLNFWRVGCPPCLKEMPYLSGLYDKYHDKGLVVLGFNCADQKQQVLDVLQKDSATFPNIVDASSDAKRTASQDYELTGVPLNYIIDRQGKVAAGWYGYKAGDKQGLEVLEKLGIK
jgi:peroxiredoxin/outer membrane lipoprotein-sorting protein